MKINSFFSIFSLFAVIALPLGAQEEAPPAEEALPEAEVKDIGLKKRIIEESVQGLTQGNNTFAAELYLHLKRQSGNLFFSPYSLSSALAMPYAGAVGATKEQIHSIMHYLQNDTNLFEAYAYLNQNLTRSHFEGPNETRLYVANSLWIQRDLQILPQFQNVMSKYFSSALRLTDFMRNPESARFNINEWVRERTQGRIFNLIGPHDVDINTRLIVVSAIFMKAVWAQAFDPSLTKQGSFFVSPTDTTSAPMMTTSGLFSIYQAPTYTLLDMPYRSTQSGEPEFSLLLFLPTENFGLDGVESAVIGQTVDAFLRAMQKRSVIVQIPKFKLNSEFYLRSTFQSMGMGIPFSDSADFSGISTSANLSFSDVIHKAYLQIDEKGSEAIAATAISISTKSVSPESEEAFVFRADHPFLFMIVDRTTNSILFMGRLISPD